MGLFRDLLNMSDILDEHWTERSCKDNCGVGLGGCMMCCIFYPAKTIGCWLYIIGSLMIFAAFWQTEWAHFHMTERSSVTNTTSMEINFQCDAGIWHVCCIKSNSMENDPTNSTDVLKCGSTTEMIPNDVLSQTELWIARLAMITSITIFLLWATTNVPSC